MSSLKKPILDEIGIFAGLDPFPHTTETCGYVTPQPSNDPAQRQLEEELRSYIDKQIKVVISDGRVYRGIFYCYDCEGNVLMDRSFRLFHEEASYIARLTAAGETIQPNEKYTALVMIPVEHIESINVCVGQN